MFVTSLGMDNFDCTKMNAHFKKNSQLVYGGGAHSRVEASITSPTSPPYVAKQLTALFHTQPLFSFLVYCSVVPTIYKPSPALEAPGHSNLLGLAYDRKTWAYPMSTVLATVAFLLLLDTSLLSQAGITHYSQPYAPAGPGIPGHCPGYFESCVR